MIGRLRGELLERTGDALVVDVHGVGYLVRVSKRASFAVGGAVDLHIHTHVRDDAIDLFGFADPFEREIFHLLIGVPSIGPVKAMGILGAPLEELIPSVIEGDVARLSRIPGVGKRTAERMVVDLRDKFRELTPVRPIAAVSRPAALLDDLVSALVNLGFKPGIAEREAARAIDQIGAAAGLDALLRHSLDTLRKR